MVHYIILFFYYLFLIISFNIKYEIISLMKIKHQVAEQTSTQLAIFLICLLMSCRKHWKRSTTVKGNWRQSIVHTRCNGLQFWISSRNIDYKRYISVWHFFLFLSVQRKTYFWKINNKTYNKIIELQCIQKSKYITTDNVNRYQQTKQVYSILGTEIYLYDALSLVL